MKTLCSVLLLLCPGWVIAQRNPSLRKSIDSCVAIIDTMKAKKTMFTTKAPIGKKMNTIQYQFREVGGSVCYIMRTFVNKDSSTRQVFYLQQSALIFSTESVTHFIQNDSSYWAGTYYFEKGKLKDYESLGHGKSEEEFWDPEGEVLENLRRARRDINIYRKARIKPVR